MRKRRGKTQGRFVWAAALTVMLGAVVTGTAVSADTEPAIRFAFQDRIGSVIPIIAHQRDLFAREGVEIDPLRFSSGPACAEALYSGAADVAAMGDTTAVITTARSSRFVIFASHATGEHRHRVMVRKGARIDSLADLKGKRLGVKKGTSTYGGLLSALNRAGIPVHTIEMIDLTPPTQVDALLAGSLDAFAASEPTPSIAEQKGARELTTLGGLGNSYPIVLLAKRDLIEKREPSIRRFVRALGSAGQYAATHPEETVRILAAETGLAPETVRRAMENHRYRLCLDESILSSLRQMAVFLREQAVIQKIPDFSGVVDRRFTGACAP